MAYYCSFRYGGNLDFVDSSKKKFYNIDNLKRMLPVTLQQFLPKNHFCCILSSSTSSSTSSTTSTFALRVSTKQTDLFIRWWENVSKMFPLHANFLLKFPFPNSDDQIIRASKRHSERERFTLPTGGFNCIVTFGADVMNIFKKWAILGLFYFIFVFSKQLTVNK